MRTHFEHILNSISANPNLILKENCGIHPPCSQAFMREAEEELGITLNKNLRSFYTGVSYRLRIRWNLNEKAYRAAAEISPKAVLGSIDILDPYEMVKDFRGNYWKNIFWFDTPHTAETDLIPKRFLPFEHSSRWQFASGYLRETGALALTEDFYLYKSSGITKHPFSFDGYLEFMIKSKGYHGLIDFYHAPQSPEFRQFLTVMPTLFDDFDADYFLQLSSRAQQYPI